MLLQNLAGKNKGVRVPQTHIFDSTALGRMNQCVILKTGNNKTRPPPFPTS